ncbi:DUF697 domain-containing protein [Belnapia sp. T6]|uniref:DUF697 domain-containing protein n=1 Tax=Belnapia mucosa TaxID=2804532 RepID=A0ABS1VAG7_9PROT|nr:DUF697 domain-containing protein [Belnapia mucosa]MBL6458681.1 DUF697 domain-containing protein [Belnapia mucosa]
MTAAYHVAQPQPQLGRHNVRVSALTEWLGRPHPHRAKRAGGGHRRGRHPAPSSGLRRHLAKPLRQATRQAGNRAALESGVVVAISPLPALDGVLAALRSVSLLRKVAAIHGMRPGAAVTLALLRRVAWTAAGASRMELLGQTLADGALSHLPGLKQLGAALPGAGLSAFRLRRLAEVAALACSPIERP